MKRADEYPVEWWEKQLAYVKTKKFPELKNRKVEIKFNYRLSSSFGAYVFGTNIIEINPRKYMTLGEARRLIAHELTHILFSGHGKEFRERLRAAYPDEESAQKSYYQNRKRYRTPDGKLFRRKKDAILHLSNIAAKKEYEQQKTQKESE